MKKQVEAWVRFAEKDILCTTEQANQFFVFAEKVEIKIKNELNK